MPHERVLLCIAPEDRDAVDDLVDATIDVVEDDDATVYILYLFPEGDYESLLEQMDVDPTSGALSPDELAARQEAIKLPVDALTEHGVDYEIRGVAGGNPAEQAVRRVDELGATLVVVGGERRSPAGKAMFGDYAQQVLLNADCPVLYVKRP